MVQIVNHAGLTPSDALKLYFKPTFVGGYVGVWIGGTCDCGMDHLNGTALKFRMHIIAEVLG